jgi:hypothetical protein
MIKHKHTNLPPTAVKALDRIRRADNERHTEYVLCVSPRAMALTIAALQQLGMP